jgi:SAM-dependent methyltransferase
MEHSFQRYLAAKKSVDDRALNRAVMETLRAALPASHSEQPLQVLELGAGIGTMLERLLAWQVLAYADYTGIDAEGENIAHAWQRLPAWAAEAGFAIQAEQRPGQGGKRLCVTRQGQAATANFEQIDLVELLAQPDRRGRYDLLLAHAFLDLIDLPAWLPAILKLLKPGGLFYFTLNFDGETIFEPTADLQREARIINAYHASMDERGSGDSRTGRRLFTELPAAGGQILNAGASDWVVYGTGGAYPGDEAYFLAHILYFFEETLGTRLPQDVLGTWLAQRRAQIAHGELVYIAHQLDFVGRFEQAGG